MLHWAGVAVGDMIFGCTKTQWYFERLQCAVAAGREVVWCVLLLLLLLR
jgi:hypothetical protein